MLELTGGNMRPRLELTCIQQKRRKLVEPFIIKT